MMMTRKKIIRVNYFTLIKRGLLGLGILGLLTYASFQMHTLFTGPEISLESEPPLATSDARLSLSGHAIRAQHLWVNGNQITLDVDQNFSLPLLLLPGYNVLTIEASDRFGKTTRKTLEIVRQPAPISNTN
jgi:hypothetical protein